MGRTFLFECPLCEYRARVSGGEDRGVQVVIRTVHCLDCRELYDAVTSLKTTSAPLPTANFKRRTSPRPPAFRVALNNLSSGVRGSVAWADYPLMCPVSPRHRVKEWRSPGKCPRCGVFMEQSGLPFRLWD